MNKATFFDNLNSFFNDDEAEAQISAVAIKDELGKIIEIRIYNLEYGEMLAIERTGEIEIISVNE